MALQACLRKCASGYFAIVVVNDWVPNSEVVVTVHSYKCITATVIGDSFFRVVKTLYILAWARTLLGMHIYMGLVPHSNIVIFKEYNDFIFVSSHWITTGHRDSEVFSAHAQIICMIFQKKCSIGGFPKSHKIIFIYDILYPIPTLTCHHHASRHSYPVYSNYNKNHTNK